MKTIIVITIFIAGILSKHDLESNDSTAVSIEEAKATITANTIQCFMKFFKCDNQKINLTQVFKNKFIAPCDTVLASIKCEKNHIREVSCSCGYFFLKNSSNHIQIIY